MEDTNAEVKESLDDLLTLEDLEEFGQMVGKGFANRIKRNPIEVINSLRKEGLINDKEYKDIIINVNVHEINKDFE